MANDGTLEQTLLPFVFISNYTLVERVGIQLVSTKKVSEPWYVVTICGTHGMCQPKFNFLKNFLITEKPNSWANEDTSIANLNQVRFHTWKESKKN